MEVVLEDASAVVMQQDSMYNKAKVSGPIGCHLLDGLCRKLMKLKAALDEKNALTFFFCRSCFLAVAGGRIPR